MSWKWIGILAVLAVALFVIAEPYGGGSSDHSSGSSEWSSGDVASVESKLADGLTERGLTPTKSETECLVKGYEAMGVPASVVLEDASTSPQQEEEIHQFVTNCGISSSGSEESSELSTEAPESVIGGPACQEDLESSACSEEEQEKVKSAQEEEMEIYEESQESAEAPLP